MTIIHYLTHEDLTHLTQILSAKVLKESLKKCIKLRVWLFRILAVW